MEELLDHDPGALSQKQVCNDLNESETAIFHVQIMDFWSYYRGWMIVLAQLSHFE